MTQMPQVHHNPLLGYRSPEQNNSPRSISQGQDPAAPSANASSCSVSSRETVDHNRGCFWCCLAYLAKPEGIENVKVRNFSCQVKFYINPGRFSRLRAGRFS